MDGAAPRLSTWPAGSDVGNVSGRLRNGIILQSYRWMLQYSAFDVRLK